MNLNKIDVSIEKAAHSGLQNYTQPLDLPFSLPTRVYGVMLAIWLLQPALQRRFPLYKQRRQDYLHFLAWCTYVGRRHFAVLRDLEPWNHELAKPVELPTLKDDRWPGCFSVGMYLIGVARSNYWAAPLLVNPQIRHQVARWYWRGGRNQVGLSGCADWQIDQLVGQFKIPSCFYEALSIKKDKRQPALAAQILLEENADLLPCFSREHRCSLKVDTVPVSEVSRISLLGALLAPKYFKEVLWLKNLFGSKPSADEVKQVLGAIGLFRTPALLDSQLEFGVNLFGYARGELGIGEDVRMLAHSLEAAKVPFCIVNVQPGKDVSQSDRTVDDWITDSPKYLFNIFCMTGIEQTRVILERGGDLLQGRYTIGLWPWELPSWPEYWHHAWNLVNEVWGISRYTADAYIGAPVPVQAMPLPVQLGTVSKLGRKDFNLPDGSYLYVFSFDLNSTLSRKNPEAVIDSFQKAFPANEDADVGLVIKINHAKSKHTKWNKLKRRLLKDSRIRLIEGSLRKEDVLALYKNCDCFVSLHRSEGFGRAIAEAQLLGLKVITTGYSGNLDFCNPESSDLVNYHLRPLRPGEYFCGEGQEWAEPDVEHAAKLMQKLYSTRNNGAQSYVETQRFSPDFCGKVYRERLLNIYFEFKGKGVTLC